MDKIQHHENTQHTSAVAFIAGYAEAAGRQLPPPMARANRVQAVVNHGRWVIECPSHECGGAVIASEGDPFMCPYCFNASNEGRWYNVQFPPDKKRIEATLLKRPDRNRNWLLGESVAQLENENRVRGIR